MALSKLRTGFTRQAAAATLTAAAVLFVPLSSTFAEDAKPDNKPVVMAAATTPTFTPVLLEDARGSAQDWSIQNPGIAVAVKLGTQSDITPQQIRDVLTTEFTNSGVNDVSFFYEQNDTPSTAVAYYYSGKGDGPFLLNQARAEARDSAAQYLFQQSHPGMAFTYNQ